MRSVILERCIPEPNSGCWLWLGAINLVSGYGYAPLGRRGARQLAHRMSFEAFTGTIPAGFQIDHRCKVRSCVNPDHLEAVTQQVNHERQTHTNQHAAKTECANGHPFNDKNTYQRPTGGRACRACMRERYARRRDSRRTAMTNNDESPRTVED